jgi:hypothetical protein
VVFGATAITQKNTSAKKRYSASYHDQGRLAGGGSMNPTATCPAHSRRILLRRIVRKREEDLQTARLAAESFRQAEKDFIRRFKKDHLYVCRKVAA